MKKKVTLITGGGRSGKSRLALERAAGYARKGFVATAVPFDEEMQQRIAKHREDRDPAYITVEAPIELAAGIRALEGDADVAVVDCLTVWLGNLMHRYGEAKGRPTEIDGLMELLKDPPLDLILVTNEVGLGIIPPNKASRIFRDLAGFVNQEVAAIADEVVMAVCGLGVKLKAEN